MKWHKIREFGHQAEGTDHPVFVITLPEAIRTVGVRLKVERSKQAAVGVFELELY